jgi:hypothetical protein
MANLVNEQDLFFTAFEPKVQNRFIMLIDGIPSYTIKGINRPKMKQEPVKINHINLQRYTKGKSVWEVIDIDLYDPIVPSASQAVMEWVRLHHESVTGRDGYAEFYKKDILIHVLGPVGDIVEEWILKGTQIVDVDFGKMAWDTDTDLANIKIRLQPDFCILNY